MTNRDGNLYTAMAEKTISFQGYRICTANLNQLNSDQIQNLRNACRKVEERCWNPLENFDAYFSKNDAISYIVEENTVVGFLLATHWEDHGTVVCSLEEMMILETHRGLGCWRPLMLLLNHLVASLYINSKTIKHFCNIANTCNPAMMMLAKKSAGKYLATTFTPNQDIVRIAQGYIEKHQLTSLHEECPPFYLKQSFPGCSKIEFNQNDETIKKLLPPKFNFARGDSMLALLLRKLHTEYAIGEKILYDYRQVS